MDAYILVDGEIKPVDTMEAMRWFGTTDRIIERTTIDDNFVSTVFLCFDHNFSDQGAPILFETMIFGGKYSEFQQRYRTLAEAKHGHARVVENLRAKRDPSTE